MGDGPGRKVHRGVDPARELTNEEVLSAAGMQIADPRAPVEPFDAMLGKFAHDYFGKLFGPADNDWKREVKLYTHFPGELKSRPLRIDRVKESPNGDTIVEIKPDTPEQVAIGQRKAGKVYKPLREKQTGRKVARAYVATYSKMEVFLLALKYGYIDLETEYRGTRLPQRWRRELRRIVASRPKAAGTAATPLGMPTVVAGPERGTQRPRSRRGTRELTPDPPSRGPGPRPRRGGGGGAAVAIAGQVLGKGHETADALIIKLARRRRAKEIREYRQQGYFVAVYAVYEQQDTRDVLRGIDPKPDEIARGVFLRIGRTKEEALGTPDAKVNPARRGRMERIVRRAGETREELLDVLSPYQQDIASDESILGPYRIAVTDPAARRADPLVLARTLWLTEGTVDRFAVTFQSTDLVYRGIVTQPGFNRFSSVFVRFSPKSTEKRSFALPKNWHYGITSDMAVHKLADGQVFIRERFEGISRALRPRDRGIILWQRVAQ